MKKKKITPKDLELNIEEIGRVSDSQRLIETRTCHVTRTQTCNAEECETATTKPTVPDCKTIAEAGCRETDTCWSIEPACETKVGCVDSASHAQLCCPYTNQKACQNSVNNCISSECVDSVRICQVTQGYPCVGSLDKCAQLTDLDTPCGRIQQ